MTVLYPITALQSWDFQVYYLAEFYVVPSVPIQTHPAPYTKPGKPFWGHMAKFSIHFKKILLRAHGNVAEQNKVFESSKIIIIIIINVYYN